LNASKARMQEHVPAILLNATGSQDLGSEAVFTVNPCDLEIYMEKEGRKIIEPGTYLLYAGGSCLDERVSAEIELD